MSRANIFPIFISLTLFDELEGPIVVVVFDFRKQHQGLSIVFAGVEHNHWDIINDLMKIVQHCVGPKDGIALSHTYKE